MTGIHLGSEMWYGCNRVGDMASAVTIKGVTVGHGQMGCLFTCMSTCTNSGKLRRLGQAASGQAGCANTNGLTSE